MKDVRDDQLKNYVIDPAAGIAQGTMSSVAAVNTVITTVNGKIAQTEALKTINNTSSTGTEVRAALLEVALISQNAAGAGAKEEAARFINLSPQARLEVAELVKEARATAGTDFADIDAINDQAALTTAGAGALVTAMDDHQDRLDDFNAIGDLASGNTSKTQAALVAYGYDAYDNLTTVKKIAVAEEINKLVHVDKDGVETPYNFTAGQKDEVKTFAAANAIIDAAIAATK